MATLAKLVEDLRPFVLTVVVAPEGLDVEVASVVVHDPADPPEVAAGDFLLAVGVPASVAAIPVIENAGAAGAAAVVVKAALPADRRLADAATAARVALLAAPPGASWAQVLTLIRTVLAESAFEPGRELSLAGVPGDLFSLANAIAALLDVPITIEDPQSRVIAYSGRQEEADQPRIDTILGRQVPEPILRRLRAEGVFERLKRSAEPIYFAPGEAADMGREAVAIRAGDEILGSIWAAVREPLNAERRRGLMEAANLVAVQLARSRLDADVGRRVHAELVTSILEGRPDAQEAAQRLGLSGRRLSVVAIAGLSDGGDGEFDAAGLRLWDLASFHLASGSRRVATTVERGVTYALVPASGKHDVDRRRLEDALGALLARAESVLSIRALAGIGGAADLEHVPRSRSEADQVLRVARSWGLDRPISTFDDVRLEALLLQLSDLVGRDESLLRGPLERLAEHDRRHSTQYLRTLRAYFSSFGDVRDAARLLNVHVNTLRYRLRKAQELAGARLDDPDQRLLLMLQLRLLELRDREPQARATR